MEVALLMKGRRDQWKEQEMQKCFLCVCCELGGRECCHLFQIFCVCVFI